MGLDIGVFPFVKIPDDITEEEELYKSELRWSEVAPEERVPEQFVKQIRFKVFDVKEMFKRRGLNYKDYTLYDNTPNYVIFEPNNPKLDYEQFQPEDAVWKFEDLQIYAYGAEIGYQRKGANQAFYDDGLWGTKVFTEEKLLEHWNKYFSDPHNEMYDGKVRDYFYKHIIKHFKEGENFVYYY